MPHGSWNKLRALINDAGKKAAAGRFSEARTPALEADAIARELLPHPDPLREVSALRATLERRAGNWPAAEAILEEAVAVLHARAFRNDATPVVRASLALATVLRHRERFDRAWVVLEDRLRCLEAADHALDRLELELEQVRLLSAMGRHDEAVQSARTAQEHLRGHVQPDSNAVWSARWALASALLLAGREPNAVLEDVARQCPSGEARDVGEPEDLRAALRLARGSFAHGEVRAAQRLAEEIRRATPLTLVVRGPHAEAIAGAALRQEPIALYGAAVQRLEAEDPRSPSLLPLLDGLACLVGEGDPGGAEALERRADAIHALVTGRRPGTLGRRPIPLPAALPGAVAVVWPRRTWAGVFTVLGVDRALAEQLLPVVCASGRRFGGLQALVDESRGELTVVIEGWENPWKVGAERRFREFLDELTRVVDWLNALLASRGLSRVGIEVLPWWSVQDALTGPWQAGTPDALRHWREELLPSLPGWRGGSGDELGGFGASVEQAASGEQARSAAPFLTLALGEAQQLIFRGAAPARLLDAWFGAFSRATRGVPPDLYVPFLPTVPVASA